MTLRFYAGGPRAIRGTFYWVASEYCNGCKVARMAGADIPSDTYNDADSKVSQYLGTLSFLFPRSHGANHTAILPLEDEE